MKTSVLESLFNKVAGLQTSNFIKRRLQQRCFPIYTAKFFESSFSIEHLRWWLLNKVLNKPL